MCSYKHSNLLQDGRSYCVAPIVTPGTTRAVWRWEIRSLKRWTVASRTVDIFDVYYLFSNYIHHIICYYKILNVVSFPVWSILIQISHTPRGLECPYVIVVVQKRSWSTWLVVLASFPYGRMVACHSCADNLSIGYPNMELREFLEAMSPPSLPWLTTVGCMTFAWKANQSIWIIVK